VPRAIGEQGYLDFLGGALLPLGAGNGGGGAPYTATTRKGGAALLLGAAEGAAVMEPFALGVVGGELTFEPAALGAADAGGAAGGTGASLPRGGAGAP